jgi:hypothetical protein
MSETRSKIKPIAAMAIAALLVAVSTTAAVPLQNAYAAGPYPPDGGEGCTPGFWKNHPEEWPAPYDPSDEFDEVFGVVIAGDPTLTLGEALELGGGGENALARHAVAALLNAASGDVNFEFTVAEVINIVQEAIATGNIEEAKNELEAENETVCPLPL